jgi:hypothetical protein
MVVIHSRGANVIILLEDDGSELILISRWAGSIGICITVKDSVREWSGKEIMFIIFFTTRSSDVVELPIIGVPNVVNVSIIIGAIDINLEVLDISISWVPFSLQSILATSLVVKNVVHSVTRWVSNPDVMVEIVFAISDISIILENEIGNINICVSSFGVGDQSILRDILVGCEVIGVF